MLVARSMVGGLLLGLVLMLAAIFPAAPSLAQPANNIVVEWVAEEAPRPGATVMTALRFVPRSSEWHGYWSNPGDAGLGMQVRWRLPVGWQAGEPLYPVPQTLRIAGLMNHVYKGEHAVLVPVRVGAGQGPVTASLDYLACTDTICVPQQATVSLRVAQGQRDQRFDAWRAAIAPDIAAPVRFATEGDRLRLAIPLPAEQALSEPHLFIANEGLVTAAGEQAFFREGDLLVAELPLADASGAGAVSGILSFAQGGGDGVRFTAVPGAVPAGLPPLRQAPEGAALVLLLGGSLLGGLLLNIMPCVFPILSLKAMTLVRAGISERAARADSLAYTAGAVLASTALGAVILLLRAGGEQVGWAFQLQEPGVVVGLFLLAVAITANFLGLYELPGLPIRSGGKPAGAFATGILAAFVATPCTGPFMAAALGAALLLPAPVALAMFAVLGLGLALPFLLLGFVPAFRDRLPRPGNWMTSFRRWMALPMGLTAAALLWLAWRFGGVSYVLTVGGAGALLVALLGWWGRAQRSGSAQRLLAGWAALATVLLAVAFLPVPRNDQAAAAGLLDARPFSYAALAEARSTGAPVFVWFTADWCLTCKVNEGVAIDRDATRAAFDAARVVALRGDWTRRDAEITRFLGEQGAAGVPLYLWYPPGGAAEQLPQVLTPAMLTERAQAAARMARAPG